MSYEIVESRKAEDENLAFCNDTIQLKGGIESAFLSLGERLRKIRDGKLYKPQWESFDVYLEEMKLTESTASKLINIYQKFVLEYHIEETKLIAAGGWSILAEILPYVQDKEKAEEAIDLASGWTKSHIRQWLREQRSGIAEDSCQHESNFYLKVCRNCGQKVMVNEDNHE